MWFFIPIPRARRSLHRSSCQSPSPPRPDRFQTDEAFRHWLGLAPYEPVGWRRWLVLLGMFTLSLAALSDPGNLSGFWRYVLLYAGLGLFGVFLVYCLWIACTRYDFAAEDEAPGAEPGGAGPLRGPLPPNRELPKDRPYPWRPW